MYTRRVWRIILYGILLIAVSPLPMTHAEETGVFEGTWTANGTRVPFSFEGGREVYTYKLAGHVNLRSSIGKQKDYWAECVGLSDSSTGTIGRCVWKDLAGPEIYVTLQSDRLMKDSRVNATIVGGTGPLAGIGGEMSFNWNYVMFLKDENGNDIVTGQTADLAGQYRIP